MSFTAKLNLGSNEYRLIHFQMEFSQNVNQEGEPISKPHGGRLSMVVESSKSNEFIEWMLKATLKKNGKLVFNRRDAESEMKRVEFEDGYCVYYKEIYNAHDENPMLIHLGITARKITINSDNQYESSWSITEGGDSSSPGAAVSTPVGVASFNPND